MGMIFMRPVPGFEGSYSVTIQGRIYSHARADARGNRRKAKYLKPIPDGDGYLRAHLCLQAVRRKWPIHRLVAIAFLPNPEGLPEVNHKDGDKTNNNVTNLEWVTTRENIKHAIEMGLMPTLERNQAGQFMRMHQWA